MDKDQYRVLVCGGRNYDDRFTVFNTLSAIPIECLAHGGATGADWLAGEWAKENNILCEVYPADWSLGKGAGPIRNATMLKSFKPDLVVAFPGGKGTDNMIQLAKRHGVEVIEVGH